MGREFYFIADDFGWSREANRAMVQAHRDGVLKGVSLMMGQPDTEDAVALAKENPSLEIGWHLHLCDSQPVTREKWPWGSQPVKGGFQIGLTREGRDLMRREVRTQWELFKKTGLPCAFVNSHHHLHSHPMVLREIYDLLSPSFKGWIRLGQPCFFPGHRKSLTDKALGILMGRFRKKCPFPFSSTLWGVDRAFRMDSREITAAIGSLGGGLHEFLFHPRKSENDLDLAALIELKKIGFCCVG